MASARIVFVICPSYHGATLLGLLLNNHSRVSALGDTNPSRIRNSLCACGERFGTCVFWNTVASRLELERFSHLGTLLPDQPPYPWPLSKHRPFESRTDSPFTRGAGRLVTSSVGLVTTLTRPRGHDGVEEYARTWESFYDLIRELHGTSIVVDGTKHMRKIPLMAGRLGEENIAVIHLVRDPRGFVASRRRHHRDVDVRGSSWLWADSHSRIQAVCAAVPYLQVRYEDLARRPEQEATRILEFLGAECESVVGPPRFPEKHHLVGNVGSLRFDGSVALDERWREELAAEEQARVLHHAGKIARKYGYG